MHLRNSEPRGDLGLGHVLKKPKQKDGLLTFGQRRDQRTNSFDIEHLF